MQDKMKQVYKAIAWAVSKLGLALHRIDCWCNYVPWQVLKWLTGVIVWAKGREYSAGR